MKARLIRERYAGLIGMSRRALPSPSTEGKVHFLVADRFKGPYEATEKMRLKVIEDHPAPDGTDEERLPPHIAEARQEAMDAAMEKDVPVRKIPDHMRIKSADMPKALKGEEGWRNATANAELKILLGSLYVREGEEIVKDQPEGFEPDEAPEPATVDPMAEHVADSSQG